MQAEGGIMGLTGEPDGAPARVGCSMVDFMTGATGATGLLACILRAQKTGRGCDVDTCLFDVAMHQLSYSAIWYLNEREPSHRQPRSAHLAVAPVQTFPTADGWIFIMCMTDKFWLNLVHTLGRTDLATDARFANSPLRRQNRDALTEVLDGELRKRPTRDWIEAFAGLLPVAPVYEMDEALDAGFPHRTGMIRNVPAAGRADFRVLGNPIKVDGKRPDQVAAPTLGADNNALLGEAQATGKTRASA
jgi:crotonobetainyl-CoA:carnitine CoA-transferase CaiB-like acyl-CoA transferase